MSGIGIIDVNPQNVQKETLFCIKDILNPGFQCKQDWFVTQYQNGLRMKILKDAEGQMIGFVEYLPASMAWRPIEATNYMFIHCMYIYPNKNKKKGYGSLLIETVEQEAKLSKMSGVCVVTSKGPWMTDMRIFEKNGYTLSDKKGRFELLSKKWSQTDTEPAFIDWTAKQEKYQGWHLLYSDQCPWHDKSVKALMETANEFNIDLQINRIKTAKEAKDAPSGFGVFSLLHDGRLLEDHYLSATRFKNILKKELQLN